MIKRSWFLFLILAVRFSHAALPLPKDAPSFTAREVAQGYRDGVLIAKPRAAQRSSADAAEQREGRRQRHKFSRLADIRVLEPASGESTEEAIERLRATGRYEFVEPDRIIRARATPNDPAFPKQWALENIGQDNGTAAADIGAVAAWDRLRGAPNVIVAVVDSGMRLTHSDLAGNLWTNPSPSANGYTNDLHGINAAVPKAFSNNGNPSDDNGHGTHVAGTIGAVGNNSVGVAGVAWKVQLMPLKFITADGSGSTSANIACIDYAIAHGAAVINASYGSTTYSAAEFAAIRSARDAGIIFVAAAGNDGTNTDVGNDYPAGYALDNIVTVAATTRTDALASFSNYGAGSVDLAAPGDSIYSTYHSSDAAYQTLSGTSMAAPHVAGAFALLKANFPSDNYRQLINRLLRGTTPLPALAGKVQSGGRLNLARALSTTSNTPLNDDFASRATLAGTALRVRASSAGATAEAGEPAHAGIAGGASLWWTWTAPSSDTVTFDASESAYTAAVAVYTGSALDALQVVSSATGKTAFQTVSGTTYQIAVTGGDGSSGLTLLRIRSIPANDAFATAQALEGPSVRVDATNVNASRETGEPTIAGITGGHSLWYRWTAPATGRFMLAAFSTETNTLAAVYTGTALASLTLVASNNNSSTANSDALVGFNATAGSVYWFQIDNADAAGGNISITLTDALWQYPANGDVTSSPAVGSDGSLYFGSTDGYVYALTSEGALKWRTATGNEIDLATPAIGGDGTVYIGSIDGYLYALNGATGARKWRFASTSSIYTAPAIASDGTVYFRDNTTLYALTSGATSATRKWSFALAGATYSAPTLGTDGTIYLGATGGTFYAVNPDGTQKWKFTADGDVFTSPAIGVDGVVYFATLSGSVYALQPDGGLKWTWQVSGSDRGITSSLAIGADGALYFAGYDHVLHALRSDGTEKWAFAIGDEVRSSSPAIGADGTIYFGAYDGHVYAVRSDGSLLRRYATAGRIRSSPLLANGRLYVGSNDAKLYAFNIGQNAAASAWPMARQNAARTGRAASGAVTIAAQPLSQTAILGSPFKLSVAATSEGALTYQWYKDGVAMAGATSATYAVASVTAATAGTYTVVITGSAGAVTSAPAVVTVAATAQIGHLINLSVRAPAGSEAQTLVVGFAVSGEASILLRGIGPALTAFGVNAALPDPELTLFSSVGTSIDGNDNWGGNPSLAETFTGLGAFALSPASKDAALARSVTTGSYTAHVTSNTSESGTVLAEIYDTAPAGGGHLVNISGRAQVGTEALIAGFVISGNVPKQVLIRGIGPTLGGFGVTGALADPKLELYNTTMRVQANDDWSTSANKAELVAVAASVGAFALGDGSKDAALLVTLPPGSYTAVVSGASGGTGVALVEVYEAP